MGIKMKIKQSHPLIIGTLILTATGLLSRLIGFFYRIYLSRLFGQEGMGIYQLLSPVQALAFSLTAAGYQTAISKLVAERSAILKRPSIRPLFAGLSISLPLSLLCNVLVYFNADFIAGRILLEPRTASMLRILSFSIPFNSVHACVNGYFYGAKKAGVPAASQLIEQLTRVGCVYAVSGYYMALGRPLTISVAILGLTVGELVSMCFSGLAVLICGPGKRALRMFPPIPEHTPSLGGSPLYKGLLAMALPLTANRIVLNLLQSMESISIPARLRMFGYDNATALSVYGVLTGMAMPLIFFPNALTSSVAILLLPIISESFALRDMKTVRSSVIKTIKYCGLMGLVCMIGFVTLGQWMGNFLFQSTLAGHFIKTLGFVCPFLYLDTTLSSILQGLGKAVDIFFMNAFCLLIRLGFVYFAIPSFGITGYLWGLLASQLLLGMLYLISLYRFLKKH